VGTGARQTIHAVTSGDCVVDKVLIAYTSKGGAAKKIAETLAEILQDKYNFWVDTVNLTDQSIPYFEEYSGIVIGTGIREGEIYPETDFFLSKDFGSRPIAYYTCSGFISPKTYEETVAAYITNTLAKHPNVKPVTTEAFWGYNKVLGLLVNRKIDLAKVEAWANEIGEKFSKTQ
jgi:menaquinone-dependent protoporphyrinogen IX oxidase